MVKRRRIVVLTGIRSEYDILFSPMRAIQEHPNLELQVVVTGAHLAPSFGYTVQQIEEDGFPIADRIESLLDSDTASSRIKSAAIQLVGLVQTLERVEPDFLLVCGDREETIMGALAGAYMNIAVAHIAGGDIVVGNIDDSVRHAVTKLAHLHFTISEESAERVRKMGEESSRVHCVGNPALDRFRLLPSLTPEELSERLDFDLTTGPILLAIQHVISSEIEDAGRQMRITMDAIAELGYKTLISYPNSDAGSREIIRVIDEYAQQLSFVKTYRSLPRLEFVNLLKMVDVLIGNSSLGILEAPYLKLPVINVGNRQKKRQHAENVIYVPHDKESIKQAVQFALTDQEFREQIMSCSNLFGDGYAGEQIARVLADVQLGASLIIKDWAY